MPWTSNPLQHHPPPGKQPYEGVMYVGYLACLFFHERSFYEHDVMEDLVSLLGAAPCLASSTIQRRTVCPACSQTG